VDVRAIVHIRGIQRDEGAAAEISEPAEIPLHHFAVGLQLAIDRAGERADVNAARQPGHARQRGGEAAVDDDEPQRRGGRVGQLVTAAGESAAARRNSPAVIGATFVKRHSSSRTVGNPRLVNVAAPRSRRSCSQRGPEPGRPSATQG